MHVSSQEVMLTSQLLVNVQLEERKNRIDLERCVCNERETEKWERVSLASCVIFTWLCKHVLQSRVLAGVRCVDAQTLQAHSLVCPGTDPREQVHLAHMMGALCLFGLLCAN